MRPLPKLLSTILKMGVGSITNQCLQLVNALFVIRIVSVEHYGAYVSLVSLATIASLIINRGFDGAIVALSRDRSGRSPNYSRYLRASLSISFTAAPFISFVFLVVYFLRFNDELSGLVLYPALFCMLIIPSLLFFRKLTDSEFVLNSKPERILRYRAESEMIKLVSLLLSFILSLDVVGVLGAYFFSAFYGALRNFFGTALGKVGKLDTSFRDADLDAFKDLKRQTNPLLPGIIFSSFQSNIMVLVALLIAGSDVIASIAVSQRFSLFFILLMPIINYFVLPRLNSSIPLGSYFLRLSSALFLATLYSLIVFLLLSNSTSVLLYVLGDEYEIVLGFLGPICVIHTLNLLNSILWVAQVGRKWIWSWMPFFSIPATLVFQAFFIGYFKIDTISGGIYFGLASGFITLFIRLTMLGYGIIQSNREAC
jgi:O-antigen/teichoic acid export membrane protein